MRASEFMCIRNFPGNCGTTITGSFQVILKLRITTSVSRVFLDIITKKDSPQISDHQLNYKILCIPFMYHQYTVEKISLNISNGSTKCQYREILSVPIFLALEQKHSYTSQRNLICKNDSNANDPTPKAKTFHIFNPKHKDKEIINLKAISREIKL